MGIQPHGTSSGSILKLLRGIIPIILYHFQKDPFCQKISLKSDFIQFFHDFIYVCLPGAGADSPQGTKF